ncbi:TlpA disulfide reductase family protein [Iodidimonas sp. SYSU 1G8]|uniref:TlpA disulfide reductase family protein n=1 Tax=Iodidimonas sp. SYSU 1G8 TaxID=3133967 RepID=UPI0031FEF7E5
MPDILQIGPIAMASDRAIAIGLLWAFLALGTLGATRLDRRAPRATWIALLAGILAARIGFVTANAAAYSAEPWSVIALWQGGFSPWAGVAAAALALAVMLGRSRAGALMIGAVAALALVHLAATQFLAPEPRPLPQGIVLTNLNGAPMPLETLQGTPLVVNLWATWCPPCRREIPMIVEVARTSSVPILLVNQGEPASTIRSYLSREGLRTGAVRLDPTSALGKAIGSAALPTTLFIDADGKIRRVHVGEISRAALTAGIGELKSSER